MHENLLPTRNYKDLSGNLDTQHHSDADRDIASEEDEEMDLVIERMKLSLPSDSTFTVLAASGLRAASFCSDITFPTIDVGQSSFAEVDLEDGKMPVLATIVDETLLETARRKFAGSSRPKSSSTFNGLFAIESHYGQGDPRRSKHRPASGASGRWASPYSCRIGQRHGELCSIWFWSCQMHII